MNGGRKTQQREKPVSRFTSRATRLLCLFAWWALPVGLVAAEISAPGQIEFPGLGDPGSLTEITFEPTGAATISGSEYRLQLIVTADHPPVFVPG